MTRRLPLVLDDRFLPAAELRAAALDGELGALGDGYLVTDCPATVVERAASLHRQVPARTILIERAAAWVWGWTTEPSPVRVCVAVNARVGSSARRAGRIREAAIDADEIRAVGGIAVTSPERTLIDLARFDERADIVPLLAAGLAVAGMTEEVVQGALDRRPASAGRRRARERLAAARELAARPADPTPLTEWRGAAGQPLLTR